MFTRIVCALTAASLLCACSSSISPSLPARSNSDVIELLHALKPASGSPIKHVIVVIQENRTVDNMFNGFPGADTVKFGFDHNGKKIALQPEGLEWQYDPSHTHGMLVTEYDNGKMDGFDQDKCDADPLNLAGGPCPAPKDFTYSYVPGETISAASETSWLWILAGQFAFAGKGYGFANRMFSSRQVPSFPGHQYLIAGQSIAADNPYGVGESGLNAIWGCDSSKHSKVLQFGKKYGDKLVVGRACYDYKTIGDLMDAKGVSWKYYTGVVGTDDGDISAYDAIRHIRYGADWKKNVVTPMTNIFSDLENGTLPDVSFVTPPFAASDHGASLSAGGPAWVMSLYIALTENPALYANTAMFVTWDDSGGWYDHVAPPSDSFGPLGFRVPLITISPYARQKVSHRVHTFGSILHYIENNWGLGTMGQQDAQSDDLADMFNYKQTPIPPVANFGSYDRAAFERKYTLQYWQRAALDKRPIDTDQ